MTSKNKINTSKKSGVKFDMKTKLKSNNEGEIKIKFN
jgi:hypothetical protein